MDSVERLVATYGGVLSAAQLVDAGVTRVMIRKNSELRRLRHGWYACGQTSKQVETAVSAGGALACTSVLRRAGVWTPDSGVHIRYSDSKAPRGARNCRPYGWNPPITAAVDSLEVAVESAAHCLDPEGVVVILDSMLNKKLIQLADARTVTQSSRYSRFHLAERCDPNAESGIESISRLRLRANGIKLRTQVWIGTFARVDILIGKRLIIECDGEEYHAGEFEADRERDRVLVTMGYLVIRLSYNQVMYDWNSCLRDIVTIVRRRDHLRPPKM
ncbi:MAG: endonuclease domain-containing protein [Nocardiaceae bacterium]|nr:endonuclease domain-containing protein [Nocardiaceae bacterium]